MTASKRILIPKPLKSFSGVRVTKAFKFRQKVKELLCTEISPGFIGAFYTHSFSAYGASFPKK